MSDREIDWRVYAIVDGAATGVVATTGRILDAGVGIVQLRDKRDDARATLRLAEQLRAQCHARSAIFIVNDRVDLALAAGADGVHLGPRDLPVDVARALAPNLLIGASVGTPEDALAAQRAGADYLGSGAVFDASASKPDAHHNRGLDALRAVVDAVTIPVVGIGGIDIDNAALVRKTGARGVAVIRALADAEDLEDAVRRLRSAEGSRTR